MPPPSPTDRGGQEVEAEEELVATLYGSDVVLSSVKNGQMVAVISCGEGEVRTAQRWCGWLVWGGRGVTAISNRPTKPHKPQTSKPGIAHFSIACPGHIACHTNPCCTHFYTAGHWV